VGASETVKDRFRRRIQDGLKRHEELTLAVHGKRVQASLETILVEQLVLSVGVMWEAFLSDILVVYVVAAPAPYLRGLRRRLEQSVEAKFGPKVGRLIRFSPPARLSRSQCVGLLDPKGWNVTASSAADLASRANEWLAAPYARGFSLNAEDGELVDLLVAVRNYLSHRSKGSRTMLREAIGKLSEPRNAPLRGTLRDVGTYLKAKDATGRSRARLIAERVTEIAATL
jgi:hypothetical protein